MGLEWLSIEKLQGHLWAKSDVLVISVLAQCCFCLCLEMVKEPSFVLLCHSQTQPSLMVMLYETVYVTQGTLEPHCGPGQPEPSAIVHACTLTHTLTHSHMSG